MGKLNIFEITFGNIQGVMHAGELLQGYVTMELNDEMKMRGQYIPVYTCQPEQAGCD